MREASGVIRMEMGKAGAGVVGEVGMAKGKKREG